MVHNTPQAPAPQPPPLQQSVLMVKLDVLKAGLRSATDAQVRRAAPELAPLAAAECGRQATDAAVLHAAVEGLVKAVREAAVAAVAKAGPVIEQAALAAVDALRQPDQQDLARQVIEQAAAIDREKLLSVLDARLADARAKGHGVPLQQVIHDVTETFIADHYQKAVSTLTHYLLNDMVAAVLQRDVLPQMGALVREAFSQHLMLAVNKEGARPVVTAEARAAVRRAAAEACKQAWDECVRPVNLTPAPLAAPGAGAQGALQLQRQVLARNVQQLAAPRPRQAAQPTPSPSPASTPAPAPAPAWSLTQNHRPAALRGPRPCPIAGVQYAPPEAVAGADGVLTPATTPDSPGPACVPTSTTTTSAGPSARPAFVFLVDRSTGEWKKINLDEERVVDPPINRLPDELLSRVLGLAGPLQVLTACSLVCRRWRALSRSPVLWRQQALRYTPDDALARQHFCRVLRLAPCLGRLDLGPAGRGSRAMPQYVVKAALETACVLRKLRVVAKGMDADFVMQLLRRHGPNLEELDLTTSVEVDARDALAAVDGMGLVGLRLAGRFDEEYNFGPRKIGAPRRALETLDLADFRSASNHTAVSLVSANMSTLTSVAVPADAAVDLMVSLSLCSKLTSLSAPADVLDWSAPPPLCSVVRLTVRPAAMHSIRLFRSDLSAGGPDAAPLLPLLDELVLDGLPAPEDVPRRVRECYGSVRSASFLGTNMGAKILDVVRAMPELQHLVLDGELKATDVVLKGLPGAAPRLCTLRVSRSLRCADGLCWQPVDKFLRSQLPMVSAQVRVDCTCPQSR